MNEMMGRLLEGQLSDYLNNHLSDEDREVFEKALASDSELRAMLNLERQIQAECQREMQAVPEPQFAHFAQKLETHSTRWRLLEPGWIAAAAGLVALAVLVSVRVGDPVVGTDFETLTQQPAAYSGTVLRIVATEDVGALQFQELIADYDLTVVGRYPAADAVDVQLDEAARAAELVKSLSTDSRVRFVRVMSGE